MQAKKLQPCDKGCILPGTTERCPGIKIEKNSVNRVTAPYWSNFPKGCPLE